MREDGVLIEQEFSAEEWAALRQVLEEQAVRESSFWARHPLVRVKRISGRETGLNNLLVLLTWVGYAIGLFFLVWGILHSAEGYFWQSPSLCLAMFFSVALARTAVGRRARKRLTGGGGKIRLLELYNQYFYGLAPLALVIGGTVGVAYFFFEKTLVMRVTHNAGFCFGAGAFFSSRLPASLYQQWKYLSLYAGERYSARWMLLPLAAFMFLVADFYSDRVPQAHKVVNVARQIFFQFETEESVEGWQFPVHVGSTRRKVEAVFGQPDGKIEGGQWFARAGLGVWFNFLGRATRLRFANPGQGKGPVAIAWGVTDRSGLKELRQCLGPPAGLVAYEQFQLCTWVKEPFQISAQLWAQDVLFEGKLRRKGALKQIEVSYLDQAPKP